MATHRRAILAAQWVIVVCYAVLVALPAFLPHPAPEVRLFSGDWGAASFIDPNFFAASSDGRPQRLALQDKLPAAARWHERLVLLAQYLFWGVWWPFVILSIMLVGRVWCGVLCPEGALAEFASRHGRGGAIPRWLRWSGWPFVAFVLTTIYGQLVSVYEYPQAALLILGGSTVAAVAVGWLYGKGKRVWCRYLCPVSGVFALLARLAPVHFAVERKQWHPPARRRRDARLAARPARRAADAGDGMVWLARLAPDRKTRRRRHGSKDVRRPALVNTAGFACRQLVAGVLRLAISPRQFPDDYS